MLISVFGLPNFQWMPEFYSLLIYGRGAVKYVPVFYKVLVVCGSTDNESCDIQILWLFLASR